MKKIVVAISMLFLIVCGSVHAQGIDFNHISLDEALEKAKQEDKLIFIDFYTQWCGPCKMLAKNVFTHEKVGQLYNMQFINIKLDAEHEGLEAARKYKVDAYPTLIFLNSKGDLVYKNVGSGDIASVLKLGKDAIEAYTSGYSINDLKQDYPNKLNDERFLKMYISKMIEVRESPTDAIDSWLKVQTEIKENDVDMMEFLLDHSKYLIAGGKAEEILYANFDEYWDIATKSEEQQLTKLKTQLVYNTYYEAFRKSSPELMRLYINKWKQLPGGEDKSGNLMEYELFYLLLDKDYETYKVQATAYLDSIASAKTIEELKKDDLAAYEEYKSTKYKPSYFSNLTLEKYKMGVESSRQISAFYTTIPYMLKDCSLKKSDYKHVYGWLDYASKLIPSDYRMDDLRSLVLHKQGKINDAIHFKEVALSKLNEKQKEYVKLKEQLEKMKEEQ